MNNQTDYPFSGLRKVLWPFHRHELKRLIPMFFMCLLICFSYNILRNLKDTLIVSAEHSGAEVIPYLKVWGILPSAILFTYLFTKLANRFSRNQVFYIVISLYLSFFALFTFVLYPIAEESLHPHELANRLEIILPGGFKGLIAMFRYWTLTCFYIISELWATIVLGVLFWGFANEVTKVSDARRHYGLISFGSNLAAAGAGFMGANLTLSTYQPQLPFGQTAWEQSLILLTLIVLTAGCAIIALYYWMTNYVLDGEEKKGTQFNPKKKGKRFSFSESLRYLAESPYLSRIAIIVVAYNLVINLVEVIWKDQVALMYPDRSDFNTFLNHVTLAVGILSSMTAIFMATMLRVLGWTKTALITPIVLLITAFGFFGSLYMPIEVVGVFLSLTGVASPLAFVVFFGAAQNSLSKAAKYSVFDATKEISLIPLDKEVKLKGKAAIDGFGSRLGKSGGSIIQQVLLLIFANLAAITPYVAAIVVIAITIWIYAVRSLGRQFATLTAEQEQQAKETHSESTVITIDSSTPETEAI